MNLIKIKTLFCLIILIIAINARAESDDPCDTNNDGVISGAEQYLCHDQNTEALVIQARENRKKAESQAVREIYQEKQQQEAYEKWDALPGTDCITTGNITKCRTR